MRPQPLVHFAALAVLAGIAFALGVEPSEPPAVGEAPACGSWTAVPSFTVAGAEPTAQLVRVFAALQADLTSYVFAAPQLSLAVRHDSQATARAHLDRGIVEATTALQATALEDDELYAVLAHEAFHHVLHGPHARPCNPPLSDAQMQHDEMEADAQARWLLRQAGRNPQALATVLVKLNVGSEPRTGRDTHPDIDRRLLAVR